MNGLSNTIYQFYLSNFDYLPERKRFHFASRLYLWDQDPSAKELADSLRPMFTAHELADDAIKQVVDKAKQTREYGSRNTLKLRKAYFDKYPLLNPYVSALSRIMFLQTVYQINAKGSFYKYFPKDAVESFAKQLLADPQAIAMLSTHAVNFLYMYSRVICDDETLFDPKYFLDIGDKYYDQKDLSQLQLLIYLYTHCIIGESLFYFRKITGKPVYSQMIIKIENLIEQRFTDINLDNKFEFLVCARLLGYRSLLEDRIYEEAARSMSPDGSFLIDTRNNNTQNQYIDPAASEHRNVLFILSTRDYKPLG